MKQITIFLGSWEPDFNYLRYITVSWWKAIEKELENLRKKDLVSPKQLFTIGDSNINSVDYETNSIVETF